MAGSNFEAEFLQVHNAYRKEHGAPSLTINKNLCRSAQQWAEHLLSIKTLKHSKKDYGENLYYAWNSSNKKLTGREAVESWYSEIKDYNFSRPGFNSKTGHFTQVVWKDTKELGVGLATDGNTTFVVGQYLPAGNITNVGYYEKNVLPAGSKVDPKPTGTTDNVGNGSSGINSNRVPLMPHSTEKPSLGGRGEPHVQNSLKDFEAEFLQAHNTYRKDHGAPALTMNKNLCRSAQEWAEHLLSMRTLMHSNKEHGENLYYTFSSANKKLTGREAVESWYNEIKDYNFSRPGFTSKTGHFTQVVWKDTKELGVGLATDGNTTFVVAQYLPAGNISNAGYFEKNVLPAGSKVDSKPTGTTDKVGQAHGLPGNHSNKVPSVPHSTEKPPPGGKGELQVQNSSRADSSFEAEFLQAHNAYRKQHGAPPLTMDKNLCRSAQEWAEHLLSIRTLMHSNGKHGENVYYAYSSANKKLTGREAVESWYNEIKDYNFSRPGFTSKTGHFTQVVWKDTKELGVGLATDGNTTFVVGQYLPAGNISNAGYYEKNVLPAGSKVDHMTNPTADKIGLALGALNIKSNQLPSSSHSSGPAPNKSSEKGESLSQFRQSLLEAENDYRRQHGARPLSLCPVLCKEAQDWAAHLISINALKNSGKGHGETMSYKWTSTMEAPTGKEVAESWYKESVKYNFATPEFQSGTGNFTQMIWRSTEQIGVGLASDGKGKFITVVFYKPSGNITNPGYFQDNVKPSGSLRVLLL